MRAPIACLLALAFALAACGRKADLEVPPGGAADSRIERDWKEEQR